MTGFPFPPEGPKLLIVDDDRDLLRSLAVRFRDWGFQVAAEHDGATAISKAAAISPDAILLDLRMPRMDGFQFLEKLAQKHETADIPVLIMTANVAARAKSIALDFGVRAFVTKPFEPRALFQAVISILPQFEKLNQ